MITAHEAHLISFENKGNSLQVAISEQINEIEEIIKSVAQKGFSTYFYQHQLYPDVLKELEENGYNIERLYEDIEQFDRVGKLRVFTGYNISW